MVYRCQQLLRIQNMFHRNYLYADVLQTANLLLTLKHVLPLHAYIGIAITCIYCHYHVCKKSIVDYLIFAQSGWPRSALSAFWGNTWIHIFISLTLRHLGIKKPATRAGFLHIRWCREEDLNLHELMLTDTWSQRVYQFRHLGSGLWKGGPQPGGSEVKGELPNRRELYRVRLELSTDFRAFGCLKSMICSWFDDGVWRISSLVEGQ